ncbi:MAG: hypothetical protein ACJ8R9_04380 [Steroidobacteraceae bacterium]
MNMRDSLKCVAISIAATLANAQTWAQQPPPSTNSPALAAPLTAPVRPACAKAAHGVRFAAFVTDVVLDNRFDFGGAFLERNHQRCDVAAGQFFYAGDTLRVKGSAKVKLAYFGGRFEIVQARDMSFDPGQVPAEIQKKLEDLRPLLDIIFNRQPAEKKPVNLIGANTEPASPGGPWSLYGFVGFHSAGEVLERESTLNTPCTVAQIAPGIYFVNQERAKASIGWQSDLMHVEYKNSQGAWSNASSASTSRNLAAPVVEVPYDSAGTTNIRLRPAQQPDTEAVHIELKPAKVPPNSVSAAPDDLAVQAAWLLWGKQNPQWKVEGFSELIELATKSAFARQTLHAAKRATEEYGCQVPDTFDTQEVRRQEPVIDMR